MDHTKPSYKEQIVLFRGTNQYNALDIFIEDLSQSFKKLGFDSTIIDLSEPDWSTQIQTVYNKRNIKFFLGINGMGYPLQINNCSLYDLDNIHSLPGLLIIQCTTSND
jgi:hypothetical protein